MKFWPIKILSTLFWLGVTVFFFLRWREERTSSALGFTICFALLLVLRSYILYREWRAGGLAARTRN